VKDSGVLKFTKFENLRYNIVLSAFQYSDMRIGSQTATCNNIPELIPVLECTVLKTKIQLSNPLMLGLE